MGTTKSLCVIPSRQDDDETSIFRFALAPDNFYHLGLRAADRLGASGVRTADQFDTAKTILAIKEKAVTDFAEKAFRQAKTIIFVHQRALETLQETIVTAN